MEAPLLASEDDLMFDDEEYTVDGCHPNDWGMMQMGRAHAKAVRTALGLESDTFR